MPRPLSDGELDTLRAAVVPARLATLDGDGYPHVTPIWFIWDGEAFRMTSLLGKPHVHRLRRDQRAGLVIDIEDAERDDGERPNAQLRVVGDAEVSDDVGGAWTHTITLRYLRGPGAARAAQRRASQPRVVITLRPQRQVAVASV
jgi:Pyridoxamine 5'-phosphate oxidase